jgi:hypothetical protein
MKWLYITLGLLACSVCLVGWIYLRDRDTSGALPPTLAERQRAEIAATIKLDTLGGADCPSGCVTVLGRTQPQQWLMRITVKGHPQCLQINLHKFRVRKPYDLTGVRPSPC